MPKFRKKPVVIEAHQLQAANSNQLALWCAGRLVQPGNISVSAAIIQIPTLEGLMEAKSGDWIIKGVKGEFYPCRADIFAATYEEVS